MIYLKNDFFCLIFKILYIQKFNFNKILSYYKNINFIVYFDKFKYSYIKSNFNFNFLHFDNFIFNFVDLTNIDYCKNNFFLQNIVNSKKKKGLFKKTSSYKIFLLLKQQFFKNYLNKNFINFDFKDKSIVENFDFFEKKIFIYKNNRMFLKYNLNLKKKKKYFLNKFFKKFSKLDFNNILNIFEYSLTNLLLNSNFFFNKKDIFFFNSQGLIYLNNKIITDCNIFLNKNDKINLCFNKYFYFIYNDYKNIIYNNIKNNFYLTKQQSFNEINLTREFKYYNKLIFFKNDIPKFLEVDFISLSFIILYKKTFFNEINNINMYLLRLYNWKYIT